MARRIPGAGVPVAIALAFATACMPSHAAVAPAPGYASANAVPPDVQHVSWDLRLPKDAPVAVTGVVSFDDAGFGARPMLYPAYGVAGFLAAVAIHGAIESAAKSEQKTKMQDAANQVLAPYRDLLDHYQNRALMQEAIGRLTFGVDRKLLEDTQSAGADWVIDSAPTFLITQDQRAFVIVDAVDIYSPTAPKVAIYRNIVHAVSNAQPEGGASFWTANEGQKLKDTFADLYAMSIDVTMLAVADGPADNGKPFRTIRYMEGGTERIERGQVLHEQCGRIMLKTLRGELMSVPTAITDGCEAPKATAGAAP